MSAGIIREEACRFGEGRRLAGILTLPPEGTPRRAFVLVTAGLTPKFGPYRLYAQLARRLASEGWVVLRFDLGGIGDSGAGRSELPLERRTALELAAAVEHLWTRFAPAELVLGGLCSGAEDSLRYAEGDPRVTGLMLMDPFGYETPGWRARDLLIRGARLSLRLLGLLPDCGRPDEAAALIDYQHMGREESTRILRTLVGRAVPVHFVYTGGMRESFNHKGQLRAMFPGLDFRGLAAVDWLPRLRHTQALERDRRTVIDAVVRRREAARRP